MKDDPQFAGKVIPTCDKPLGHDRRGGHRMRKARQDHLHLDRHGRQ